MALSRQCRGAGLFIVVSVVMFLIAAADSRSLETLQKFVPSGYDYGLPKWVPTPLEPEGNPTTGPKVELGRGLFYDKRLSRNHTMSCASCHDQKLAFTDARATSPGVAGHHTPRNAMSLANVAYVPVLTWANPLLQSLEQQALVPIFGREPEELGLAGMDAEIIQRLQSASVYPKMFREAFPEADGKISFATISRALAAFQRTLISVRSPYDRYRYEGDTAAVPDAVIRGEALFFSERLECHHCHNGLHFSDTVFHQRNRLGEQAFHNTGLYNIGGKGAYPPDNRGIADITGRAEDEGRFRAPSLRNVAVTGPYMHDGSIPTLDGVIDHYAAGGRNIESGPYAGDGKQNPLKSAFVPGFTLSPDERADLIAFLNALTDTQFLYDPRFADPWVGEK